MSGITCTWVGITFIWWSLEDEYVLGNDIKVQYVINGPYLSLEALEIISISLWPTLFLVCISYFSANFSLKSVTNCHCNVYCLVIAYWYIWLVFCLALHSSITSSLYISPYPEHHECSVTSFCTKPIFCRGPQPCPSEPSWGTSIFGQGVCMNLIYPNICFCKILGRKSS